MTSSPLNVHGDVVALTAQLCDVESVSGNETELADLVYQALSPLPHLTLSRDGDTIVAQTQRGRGTRVAVAGHLDTVPLGKKPDGSPNFPSWFTGAGADQVLHGRGSVDMLGGVAVHLKCAATLTDPAMDVNYIFYDHEEVEATKNGLRRLSINHPEFLDVDFAVLGEPTNAKIEGGCNGTIRALVQLAGVSAHSARAWRGENAIHKAAPILAKLAAYDPGQVEVDGLTYRQSLSAVQINGGIAGNVIPDACQIMVNYRFAPDKSEADATAFLNEFFAGYSVEVVDSAPGARPGLNHPAAAALVALTDGEPEAKVGWTDVSRFSGNGVPAVNLGPGDPLLAHKDDERVPASQIRRTEEIMVAWLTGDPQTPSGA